MALPVSQYAREEIESMSALEFRLEISKQLADLRYDRAKYVQNGEAIIEGYEEAHVDLHLHGVVTDVEISLIGEAAMPAYRFCGLCTNRDRHTGLMAADDEMSVLVWVGIGSEPFRPIDSVIRLQPLDSCRMRVVDELEIGFAPSPESILRVLNWELRAALLGAGIVFSEFEDEILQSRPEMAKNLGNEKCGIVGNGSHGPREFENVVRPLHPFVGLQLLAKGLAGDLRLFVDNRVAKNTQLREAFFCPVETDISSIKRMHDLLSLSPK